MATGGQSVMVNGVSYSTQPLGQYTNASYNNNGQQLYRYTDQPNQPTTVSLTPSAPAPSKPNPNVNPAPSGYGTDPNFHYQGWDKDFGYGAAGQAAYEAYRQLQDIMPQIDEAFNPQNDYLNQAEAYYKGQVPSYQQEAQGNYDVSKQLLDTSKGTALGSIATQEQQGKRATEDALAKARRIFNEQQVGAQARYGARSNVGQASSELLARNLQTEQGQTQRQAGDFTQQIGQLRQQAEQKYSDSMLQLEQGKQKALNDIQREFDQKMLEITNNRTQLQSAKAQAKLQALMDLRNKTFAIQQQATQFQQALYLQAQAAQQQTSQYGQQSYQANQPTYSPQGLTVSGGQQAANPYQSYTGAISSTKKPQDYYNSFA